MATLEGWMDNGTRGPGNEPGSQHPAGQQPGSEPSAQAGAAPPDERPLTLEDLVYINRMTTVGHVLPSVAHELNNSLQVIGGLVELLTMRAELGREVQDKINKIGQQAARSAGMLREFVAFARRDDAVSRVDVAKALERALSLRRYHLARARIEAVMVDPQPLGPLVISADSQHVVQVLLNVLINAEESLAGQERRELRIQLLDLPSTVRCQVEDSGPGFSDVARRLLRKPFASTKSRGTAGLGLAVAGALMEKDRGRLEVLDGPGGRVRVEWPKAASPTG
jgi:C4-dicarboxylate-specific signal transduction histidine kinase